MGLTGRWLVTGGAGFLGRAILRRAEREGWDAEFTVASRDDAKHAALQSRFPNVDTVVADVGLDSVARLTDLLRGFDGVIHAAAWKYVDRGEHDPRAVFVTNVTGSAQIAEAAARARVRRAIAISTDKAVAPTNAYGISKAAMERIFQQADRNAPLTQFTCVRYGNVCASTGSVIPIFMAAAREGRPIRLTDGTMSRFWMTPDEAVDTVLAGLEAPGGTITIPACRSMTMHDLALMALGEHEHGPLPEDGRIEIIGVRPGEKRHEALVQRQESIRATRLIELEGSLLSIRGDAAQVWAAGIAHHWRWIQIAPPDTAPTNPAPFEVTSDQPPLGWMGFDEMRAAIADAATI